MKSTVVLIADNDAENFGRKLMLKAHRYGKMGFEMARLPQHVSLKQPFKISSLEKMESLFDDFVKMLTPFDIKIVGMDIYPSDVLGGMKSGCLSLRVEQTPELVKAQNILNEKLYNVFGPCPAEHDDDYVFHFTFAIGGTDFDSYLKAYENLKKFNFRQSFKFNKLGLFYYDDDNIEPGTYFCYKVSDIDPGN